MNQSSNPEGSKIPNWIPLINGLLHSKSKEQKNLNPKMFYFSHTWNITQNNYTIYQENTIFTATQPQKKLTHKQTQSMMFIISPTRISMSTRQRSKQIEMTRKIIPNSSSWSFTHSLLMLLLLMMMSEEISLNLMLLLRQRLNHHFRRRSTGGSSSKAPNLTKIRPRR